MSIEWMTHVWNNSKQKGSQLLMLLAIADYADEKGEAFPSIETLAQRTRQTNRNAIRILEKIEASHELTSSTYASPYGTNLYKIHVPTTIKPKKSASKRSSDILGTKSTESSDILVTQMSSNPSLTINNTPSKEKIAAKPRDPLLDHPAIIVYKDVMHLTPNELQRQEIARRVGENGRLESYRALLTDWNLHGWNRQNIAAQLDALEGKPRNTPQQSSNESIWGRKEYI